MISNERSDISLLLMGLEATIIPTVLKIKRSQIILNEKVSQMNLSSNVIQDTIFLPPFEVQFQQ